MTQAPTPGPLSEGWTGRKCPTCSGTGQRNCDPMGPCMDCGGTGDEYGSLAPTAPVEASGSEREWLQAAEAVCAEVVKRAEVTCRKATDELYEGLLYSVQDYLRENVTLNLQGELDRAHQYESDARLALVEIAKAAGVAFVDDRDGVDTQKDRILAALSTTPARAEAQDEGAAGMVDIDRYRARLIHLADLFEALLDSGKFPGSGRSRDEKSSIMEWWDVRRYVIDDARSCAAGVEGVDHWRGLSDEERADRVRNPTVFYIDHPYSPTLDEEAAGELKPCPGCGDAEPIYVGPPDAPKGKVFVGCDTCGFRSMACPKSEQAARFWNRRAHPSPTPAADADRVREAIADVISHENDWRTALTAMDAAEETPEDGSGKPGYWLHQIKVLDRILAALKSEGK